MFARLFGRNTIQPTLPTHEQLKLFAQFANLVYLNDSDIFGGKLDERVPLDWLPLHSSILVEPEFTADLKIDYYTYGKGLDDARKGKAAEITLSQNLLAIRGTVFSSPGDIADDFSVGRDRLPLRIDPFRKFTLRMLELIGETSDGGIDKSFKQDPFYIVGHSLGAVYAACLFAELAKPDGRIQCITFDNPGSKNIVKQYLKKFFGWTNEQIEMQVQKLSPFIHNIQSDVNLINTCNEQWGNVFRVYRFNVNPYYVFPPVADISVNYKRNLHYIAAYLYDQHQITNIIAGLEKEMPHPDLSPNGFAGGYRVYLDYEKRKAYWDKYFEYCWDYDLAVIEKYKLPKKTFDDFKKDMIKKLYDMIGMVELSEDNFIEQERAKFRMNNLFKLYEKDHPEFDMQSNETDKLYSFKLKEIRTASVK